MSERFRIPKFKVPVEIRTLRGSSEPASLFLADRAEGHAGRERALDVLNGDGEFIVLELSGGQIGFLRTDSLSCVTLRRAPGSEDPGVDEDLLVPGLHVEAKLKLVLDDGSELEGVTRYELPEQSSRLIDFFNGRERFVPLFQDDRITFVNKRCVARVLPR